MGVILVAVRLGAREREMGIRERAPDEEWPAGVPVPQELDRLVPYGRVVVELLRYRHLP